MVIDMHNHTSDGSPDSILSARELFQLAKEHGLDGVCVTEHGSFDSRERVVDAGLNAGVIALQGIEVNTDFGHILLYGPKEEFWEASEAMIPRSARSKILRGREDVKPSELPNAIMHFVPPKWTPLEIINETRRMGGCAVLAHPFSPCSESDKTLHNLAQKWVHERKGAHDVDQFLKFVASEARDLIELLEAVDAFETMNGKAPGYQNRTAQRLAVGLGKPGVGGSDTHGAAMVAICGTVFKERVLTVQDLASEVRAGHVTAIYLIGQLDSK